MANLFTNFIGAKIQRIERRTAFGYEEVSIVILIFISNFG